MTVDWFELAYTVIGGLCVFLFGMKALSESLQALASDFIRQVIGWLTANRVLAVAVGALVTLVVQSSSVTTVMVVGFVNAGLMSLPQAVGVILGANIGTTITGWIVALKIGKYGLAFLAAGLVPFFFVKHQKWKSFGKVSIALGFIFLGLEFMSGGFKPLTKDPDFAVWMVFFAGDTLGSVLACVAVGCVLTFIVQSSSAMLAITIALATTGTAENPPVIGMTTAVALVIGDNIGTTITAQLAAIGCNENANPPAMAHTQYNFMRDTDE
jgi:phosphate:Na+ symporter